MWEADVFQRCLHVLILRAYEITVFGGKKKKQHLKDVIKVRMLRCDYGLSVLSHSVMSNPL